ncbi:MAG TPA: hypothetical protein VF576_02030, partial [Rubricoccaceae bacterium]
RGQEPNTQRQPEPVARQPEPVTAVAPTDRPPRTWREPHEETSPPAGVPALGADDVEAVSVRRTLSEAGPAGPDAPQVSPTPAAAPTAPYVPLAYKTVDPDHIDEQVTLLRAMVAALRNLDPEAVSHRSVDDALATVPGLTDADRAAFHAEAVSDLASATAVAEAELRYAERRLLESETAFERERRGARGARGPLE